jgi:predicted dinucleotide-binding enzyme
MAARITVLGTGRMGSALARRLAEARELVSQALGEFSDNDIGAMVRLYRRARGNGAAP